MWKDQYSRMLRSIERVQQYYDGLTGLEHYDGGQAFPEFRDSVIHMFQDIFNLRDWLKNDPAVSTPDSVIDALCSGNPATSPNLHIARDVANGSKHLTITKPSQSKNTKVAATGNMAITFGPTGEMKDTVLKHSIFIDLGANNVVDALHTAKQCAAEWRSALLAWGLSP